MKSRLLTIGVLALATTTLAACQAGAKDTRAADSGAATGLCQRDAAQALAGKKRLTDEQAKQATGASIVRQIGPGQVVTMDYRQERVTIETDPRTGKIVRASCG